MLTALNPPILDVPVNPAAPDSDTIIYTLQSQAIQFGRDPRVRAGAEMILREYAPFLKQNDVLGQIKALTECVKERVTFVNDGHGAEYIQQPVTPLRDPLGLLEKIMVGVPAYGDCDDHVLLLTSLLRSLGIDARAAAVLLGPDSTYFDHVIVQVPLNGEWIDVDPCAKSAAQPDYPIFKVANIDQ